MQIKPIKTEIFKENEEIIPFILKYVKKIEENSILVISSKIVALSEGRVILNLNIKAKERLIKKESELAIKTKLVWFTIKDGMVMASAGIDESNVNGICILLPKNSFDSAELILKKLKKIFKVKKLGIIISDSGILPLRAGVIGVALGYAGFQGVRDYRGTNDIFGRNLKFSRTDVADSLATGATLCMGEGAERQPLAVITDAPVIFKQKTDRKELIISKREDIYAPFFENLKVKKYKKDAKKK